HVEPFVLELVASRRDQDAGVVALVTITGHLFGDVEKSVAGLLRMRRLRPAGVRELVAESVRKDQIGLSTEEVRTLDSRDRAYRRETVGLRCRDLLHGVLRDHVQLPGSLIDVE